LILILLFLGASHVATQNYLPAALTVVFVLGILQGNEIVRRLLIIASWVALVANVAFTVTGILNGSIQRLLHAADFMTTLPLITPFVGALCSLFAMWCLSHIDVIRWMLKRTLASPVDTGDLDEEDFRV